jgi:Rod binding domain-containing protein
MAGVVSFMPLPPVSNYSDGKALEQSNAKGTQSGEKASSELKHAAEGMESLFLYELLKSMRATVPKNGLFHTGKSEEQYTSMFDVFLSEHLAKKGELGIGSLVERQLQDKNAPKVSEQSADK